MTNKTNEDFVIKVIVGMILGVVLLSFSQNSENNSRFGMTNDEVSTIISQTNKAFDLAEEKVLKIKPNPDDTPSGPDPDPEKCICGGTGKITHGDGHQTDCPYHAKKNE